MYGVLGFAISIPNLPLVYQILESDVNPMLVYLPDPLLVYRVLGSVVSMHRIRCQCNYGVLKSTISVPDPPLVYGVLGSEVLLLTSTCGVGMVPAHQTRNGSLARLGETYDGCDHPLKHYLGM